MLCITINARAFRMRNNNSLVMILLCITDCEVKSGTSPEFIFIKYRTASDKETEMFHDMCKII